MIKIINLDVNATNIARIIQVLNSIHETIFRAILPDITITFSTSEKILLEKKQNNTSNGNGFYDLSVYYNSNCPIGNNAIFSILSYVFFCVYDSNSVFQNIFKMMQITDSEMSHQELFVLYIIGMFNSDVAQPNQIFFNECFVNLVSSLYLDGRLCRS
jgi:hypothetical protein